jgi:hypothetical protein
VTDANVASRQMIMRIWNGVNIIYLYFFDGAVPPGQTTSISYGGGLAVQTFSVGTFKFETQPIPTFTLQAGMLIEGVTELIQAGDQNTFLGIQVIETDV